MEDFFKQRSKYYKSQADIHRRKAIMWLIIAGGCVLLLLATIGI